MNAPGASVSRQRAQAALGLHSADDFRVTSGALAPDLQRQAKWYFRDETIAVPRTGAPRVTFAPGVRAGDDLRAWAAARPPGTPAGHPPLVWIAAPAHVRGVRVAGDGRLLVTRDGAAPLRLVPRIAMNRSYFDASSTAYFARRKTSLRGTWDGDTFVARTLWPEDFRIGPRAPPPRALPDAPTPALALRALMHDMPHGGAQAPFAAMTLWQRDARDSDWRGRPILALVVNGAQGDDDEAHGGHFALATGRIADDGAIGAWLVNNFYSLDVESEKGILAAPLPLDNYQGDLNSGQSWYRPSCVLVAVLRDERAAALVQDALVRVYLQFYRHQIVYHHPTDNCTSISVDTLRALGWSVPRRGPSRPLLAWLGFPWIALRERSVAKAKLAFDYLAVEQTRLLPAAAIEEAFGSLWSLAHGGGALEDGALARLLAEDLSALAFARLPQFPSSRAWGDAPALTTDDYRARIPKDPELQKIIPLPARPFPEDLRDPDVLPPPTRPSDVAARVWGLAALAGVALAAWGLFGVLLRAAS